MAIQSLPERKSQLLPALRMEQHHSNFISAEAMLRIAGDLQISPAVVHGVASFYHELLIDDKSSVVIRVCDGPSCHMAGAESLLLLLQRLIAEHRSNAAKEGKIPQAVRVERVGCLGQCDRSPTIVTGGQLYFRVRPRDLPLIFQKALSGNKIAGEAPDCNCEQSHIETA